MNNIPTQLHSLFRRLTGFIDVKVSRASALATHQLLRESQLIGALGAAETLSRFAVNGSHSNPEVASFINFYSKNYQHSRSQWSQDIFVMYFTEKKNAGTYLEIGGADGVTHSNTLGLRDYLHWSGVLVEPDPSQFQLLKKTRGPSDRVINAALDPTGAGGTVEIRQAGQYSAVVGHEGQDMHYAYRMRTQQKATVKSIDLTSLIKEIGNIDYFSLDIEGAEATILESVRWDEIIPPALITVEHNNREDDKLKLRSILKNAGYIEIFSDQAWLTLGDLWLIHADQLGRIDPALAELVPSS